MGKELQIDVSWHHDVIKRKYTMVHRLFD